MRIREAAEASKLSIDTIRYYEKSGMLPKIARNATGQREFSPDNIEWLTILYWLRKTGMPMKAMRSYAQMVHAGDETVGDRIALLRDHQSRLIDRRAELDRCDEILRHKLAIYDQWEGERQS